MCDTNDKNNNTSENDGPPNGVIHRNLGETHDKPTYLEPVQSTFQPQIRWPDLTAQIFLHAGAIYGLIFQLYTIRFFTLIWCK